MKRSFIMSLFFLLFIVVIFIGLKTHLTKSASNEEISTIESDYAKLEKDSLQVLPAGLNIYQRENVNDKSEKELAETESRQVPTGKPKQTPSEDEGSRQVPTEKPKQTPTDEPRHAPTAKPTQPPMNEHRQGPTKPSEAPPPESKSEPSITPTKAPIEPDAGNTITKEYDSQIVETAANSTANAGDFEFAHFDVLTTNNVKSSIPNLIIRLRGTVNTINPSDLTDIVLTRDGIIIENSLTLTKRIEQFEWHYMNITDFYFKFKYENQEPGNYSLTGKYKGVPFTVYNKIIEASVNNTPADPNDLFSVSWGYYLDKTDKIQKVSEIVFSFNGTQNAFYQSDLTDLKVTLNGKAIPYSFMEHVFRYHEYWRSDSGDTSFNLVLNEAFTDSGCYVISGKYRDKEFVSSEIIIP